MMTGVKTNVVTAVEIHDRDASDTKLLPPLVETTAKNFKINEVSADEGIPASTIQTSLPSMGLCLYRV